MTTFNISKNPYGSSKDLYNGDNITLTVPITYITGPNGSGKSTLINLIIDRLRSQHVYKFETYGNPVAIKSIFDDPDTPITQAFIHYNVDKNSQHNTIDTLFHTKKVEEAAYKMTLSEGQNKVTALIDTFKQAKKIIKINPDIDTLYILIDGIDSGLSIDSIYLLKNIINIELEQLNNIRPVNPYLIITANQYELIRNETVFDIKTFHNAAYRSYDEYRNAILNASQVI